MRIDRRELLSVPNCLSYFRIILLPVFIIVYLGAETTKEYYLAGGIVIVSALTDLLDGKIARKFHTITEFGKIIDPVADKLTLAVIALCLMPRYRYMIYLVVMILIKEGVMMVMGIINLSHGKKLDGAKIYGKVCTTTLFITFAALILLPNMSVKVSDALIFFEIVMVLITIVLYMMEFHRMKQTWEI